MSETSISDHLNDFYQYTVSSDDSVRHLNIKAKKTRGLELFFQRNNSISTVLKQDELEVLNWLGNKLITQDDISFQQSQILFCMVGAVYEHFGFWKLVKTSGANVNSAIIDYSKLLIRNSSSEVLFGRTTKYHEEEQKKYIDNIVNANDWSRVYEKYHRNHEGFKYSIGGSIESAFCLLYHFDRKALMSILDENCDIPLMWGMMNIIGKSEAMDVAMETSNHSLKFSAIASVLPFSGKDLLDENENEKLTRVFMDLMENDELWRHWMKILNTYPSRYPHVQLCLGKALAETRSNMSIQHYFESIYLYTVDTNDSGRKSVSECLESFSQIANKDKQKLAWTIAFEIWDAWSLGVNNKDGYLFEIKASALDYAITRYYLECCSSEERNVAIEELRKKLDDVDNVWHKSSSMRSTYWYLQQSKLQPLYHAEKVLNDSNLPYLVQATCYEHDYGKYEDYVRYMIH